MARNSNSAPNPPQINLIAEGTRLQGTLHAGDDIRISGSVDGTLHVSGKAILAEEGVVEGELHAVDADIAGTLTGDVVVEERLVLKSTARVQGTLRTGRLIIEEGAQFDGSCDVGKLEKSRAAELSAGDGSTEPTNAQLNLSGAES